MCLPLKQLVYTKLEDLLVKFVTACYPYNYSDFNKTIVLHATVKINYTYGSCACMQILAVN